MTLRLLIVEDEAVAARDLAEIARVVGYDVLGVCGDAASALSLCDGEVPDVALLDIRIKGAMDGIELAGRLRERLPLAIVFITAQSDRETVARAARIKPNAYVVKPFDETSVYVAVETAIANFAEEHHVLAAEDRVAAGLPADGLAPEVLRHVLDYMERAFARNVLLSELAAEADLSPSYFAVQFKKATGKPPHRYLTGLRVEEGKRLLAATDWPLDEVAEAVGYETAAHFSKTFKRIVGTAPGTFRREATSL